MIKAMIFDMDGVLFDTERVLKDCWIKTAKEMNFLIGEEELRQMRGASAAFCTTLFQKWYEGKVDYKKARARRSQYLEEYIDLHSIPEKKGLKELLNYLKQQNIPFAIATSTERKRASEYWQYLEEYIDLHSIPEKKGLKELLNYLKQQNIPFAIATSTERKRASEYWEMATITDLISASVCGDEVTNSKPDPEIFLTAAKKLHVPIQDCMVVEDSINGLKAARSSGAFSCMVPDLTPYSEDLKPICDFVCEDLTSCISLLESLNHTA